MDKRLAGKVIVVAGAGGIGDALAKRYAAEGAAIVLGDLDTDRAEAAVAAIAATGGAGIATRLDGADEGSIAAAVALACDRFGGLDGFHANFATSDGSTGTNVLDLPLDVFDEVMRVNARGFLLCTQQALPAMLRRGGGCLLYTSSGAVYIAEPLRAAYAMSKEAGHALMRHVSRAFGPQGIRANVIAPGVIKHGRFDEMVPPDVQQGFMDVTAFKNRLGRPEDIAAMAALLMADEGSYITGQVISVDGGNVMRP